MSGMKLPDEIARKMGATAKTRLFGKKDIETIVRDCAKVAINEDCDQTEYACHTLFRIEKAILARYGLKEE